MGRLFLLLFTSLLYPAEVVIALDSDRDHPAIVDAQDIEIDFATGQWIYRGEVTIQQGTLHMTADEIQLFFDDDVLQRAIAHGQPAVFRQQPEGSDHLIRGQAQKIEINEIENVGSRRSSFRGYFHSFRNTFSLLLFLKAPAYGWLGFLSYILISSCPHFGMSSCPHFRKRRDRYTGIPAYRYTSIPVFRYTGVPVYQYTGGARAQRARAVYRYIPTSF